MNKLSYEGLKVDLELKRKLTNLIQMKEELEKVKINDPIEEDQNNSALQKVNNLIGIIRYAAMDKLGILSKEPESNIIEKDFPGDVEGEQVHENYPDLQVGKQPKLGERQKEIIGKASFSPMAPKTSADQKEEDQNYDKENIGGEHVGNVFQFSEDGNSKPLGQDKEGLDLRSGDSKNNKEDNQELSEEENWILSEINKYLASLLNKEE